MPTTTASGETGASGTNVSGTSTATTTQNAASTTATAAATPAADQAVTADLYGIFVAIFGVVLTLVVLVSTGSIMAVLVLWTVIALMIMVLIYYGILDLTKVFAPNATTPSTPSPSGTPRGGPLVGSEVFHISQNQFTYDEAPAVCAAYGAQLATLEQIIEAYNAGAEWCGYGWSAGGMALYPTQKSTWTELQREVDPGKRTACGRPGVNGGYFDPTLKFGVNCFGFKPEGQFTPPAPLPGVDRAEFDRMVNRFKEMIKTMKIDPFSRTEWSGHGLTNSVINQGRRLTEGFIGGIIPFQPGYGTDFQQTFLGPMGIIKEGLDNEYVETLNGGNEYAPNAPFGLRGGQGEKGEKGDTGDAGPIGPTGAPGATGGTGATGPAGERGPTGATGPKGDKGDTGERGERGEVGPGNIASKLTITSDSVDSDAKPYVYWGKGPGVYAERKTPAAVGAPIGGGPGVLTTHVPGATPADGLIIQEFRMADFYRKRRSTPDNATNPAMTWWSGWSI